MSANTPRVRCVHGVPAWQKKIDNSPLLVPRVAGPHNALRVLPIRRTPALVLPQPRGQPWAAPAARGTQTVPPAPGSARTARTGPTRRRTTHGRSRDTRCVCATAACFAPRPLVPRPARVSSSVLPRATGCSTYTLLTPPAHPGGAVLPRLPQDGQPGVGRDAQHPAAVLVRALQPPCLPLAHRRPSPCGDPPPLWPCSHPGASCLRLAGCGCQSRATSCAGAVTGSNKSPRKPNKR